MLRKKRLYLPKNNVTPLPAISAGSGVFEVGTNYGSGPTPHRYRFNCRTCEVRWSDETKESKCWSCGEKLILKTNGG